MKNTLPSSGASCASGSTSRFAAGHAGFCPGTGGPARPRSPATGRRARPARGAGRAMRRARRTDGAGLHTARLVLVREDELDLKPVLSCGEIAQGGQEGAEAVREGAGEIG